MDKNTLFFKDQTGLNQDELEAMFIALFHHIVNNVSLSKEVVVSATIVDDESIHQINKQYRGIDRPTDVISFAYDDNENDDFLPYDDLGEIVISLDTAKRQAPLYNHPTERELAFLFIHGFLHLLGYDHVNNQEEAEKMYAKQNELLNSFEYKYVEVK
ncbi:MAG: rRNA maturation RNase YbeY [Bacilli bacterium]|nr:rRNA maturation RNase YbeY [Bacilli bacterium]